MGKRKKVEVLYDAFLIASRCYFFCFGLCVWANFFQLKFKRSENSSDPPFAHICALGVFNHLIWGAITSLNMCFLHSISASLTSSNYDLLSTWWTIMKRIIAHHFVLLFIPSFKFQRVSSSFSFNITPAKCNAYLSIVYQIHVVEKFIALIHFKLHYSALEM